MKAIDLLEKQHKDVRALFKRLEAAEGAEQLQIFDELAAKLVAHDAIERKIFYPACENAMGMTDQLGEALVEHGVVEFMLYEADQARGRKDFKFKCTVLQEVLEHHIEEEEDEFFGEVEKAIEDEELEELGTKMNNAFNKALAEDFRGPLRKNLSQVLAGALKPAPKHDGSSRRPPRANHSRSSR